MISRKLCFVLFCVVLLRASEMKNESFSLLSPFKVLSLSDGYY